MDAVYGSATAVRTAVLILAWAAVGCSTPDPEPYDPTPPESAPSDARQVRAESGAASLANPNKLPVARPQSPAEPSGPIVPPGPLTPPPPLPAPATAQTAPPLNVVPAGGPTPEQGATQVRVVAMIGSDIVITDDEVWQVVRQRAGEYVKLVGTDRDAREKELFREELRRLIERELILADFLGKIKKNKPQVMEELKEEAGRNATRQIREFKRMNKFTSDEAFNEALRSMGVSQKALYRQLERNAMMTIYLNQYMRDKLKGESLARVWQYYQENPAEFTAEDKVKWLDLFVSYRYFNTTVEARQYADHLAKQAAAGADFVALVKEYGHGDSKLRGGEGIGAKRGEITPRELEETVFRLGAGEVSGPVATETGFHVIKVLEREEAGLRPFDEKTQTYIRNKLAALTHKAEYEKLVEELWRKTTVKVLAVP